MNTDKLKSPTLIKKCLKAVLTSEINNIINQITLQNQGNTPTFLIK